MYPQTISIFFFYQMSGSTTKAVQEGKTGHKMQISVRS